MIFYYKWYSQ